MRIFADRTRVDVDVDQKEQGDKNHLFSLGNYFDSLVKVERENLGDGRHYTAEILLTNGTTLTVRICSALYKGLQEHFAGEDADPERERETKYAFRVTKALTERLTNWVGERFFGGVGSYSPRGIKGKSEISEANLYDSPHEAYTDVSELPDNSHFFTLFNWELVEVTVETSPVGQVTYSYD